VNLSEAHRTMLINSAISDDVIDASGARTIQHTALGPCLEFTWADGSGRTEVQIRPDVPPVDKETGKPKKYLFKTGSKNILNRLRDTGSGPVLLVEGTKQQYAALSHAPANFSVYGMAGCWGAVPNDYSRVDLSWVFNREVYVLLDADFHHKTDVYDAGTRLIERLSLNGATSVKFVSTPGTGSDGVDDVLATYPQDKRAQMLNLWLSLASGKLPKRPRQAAKNAIDVDAVKSSGRVVVDVDEDRLEVIQNLTGALKKSDGLSLFSHGGKLARYNDDARAMEHLDSGAFNLEIAKAAVTYAVRNNAEVMTVPDTFTLKAVFSAGSSFSRVDRVVSAPFLRTDGSLCSEPGYDADSYTYLECPLDIGVTVPDAPTDAEVKAAVSLLLDDWLADVLFASDEDRTAFLAYLITRATRGWYPVVPLCVINGLDKGVGKGLLADLSNRVFTGSAPDLLGMSDQEEEQRKLVTSLLLGAPESVVFDEHHVIGGKVLARLMTAVTWSDRVLGVSRQAMLPNSATWLSLGNNVAIQDDMIRRYYQVRLETDSATPYTREVSSFRHRDITGWTEGNRGRLLSAVLTLVKAWIVRGRPSGVVNVAMGSFEGWQRVVEGVLRVAGRDDFLKSLTELRSDNDVTGNYWTQHLSWLADTFRDGEFTAADVASKARGNLGEFLPPPGIREEVESSKYGRSLGYAYRNVAGQFKGGFRLVKAGMTRSHVVKYRVVAPETFDVAPEEGPQAVSEPAWGAPATVTPAEVLKTAETVPDGSTGQHADQADVLTEGCYSEDVTPSGPFGYETDDLFGLWNHQN
jgi:hypothetical protein